MSKPRIWVTRRLSDATLERAARDYEVVINYEDRPGTAEEIIAASAAFDGIIPCHSEHFSAEVVAQFSDRLKIVANHSVGVDHCDLPALKSRGIVVTNTPDVLSDATAELAMLLMLGAARHAVAGDRIVRSGAWDSWSLIIFSCFPILAVQRARRRMQWAFALWTIWMLFSPVILPGDRL